MNRGSRTESYRLEVVERRMSEGGRLEPFPPGEGAPHSAAAMLRFSPRQVTLAPGRTQKVRLMARRPKGLAEGEYRSHLMIRTLPPVERGPGEEAATGEGQLSVKLITTTAVTIPLIVRHGDTRCEVSLTDLALTERSATGGLPRLGMRLFRGGNRSSHGDVTVEWVPADGGSSSTVGRVRGVAVYVPNESRSLEVPLEVAAGELGGGELRVTYNDVGGGSRAVLAEGALVLN
jgi:hypothetical protein